MIIVGTLIALMFISSALVLSACMLSGQRSQEMEPVEGMTMKMSGQWSGTTFGSSYTTKLSHCSFEPEDLEEIQTVRQF